MPVPPTIAWPVFVRLQDLLGGALGTVFSHPENELDATAVARVYREVVKNLVVGDLQVVVLPLLGYVLANGMPLGGTDDRGKAFFNQHFAGEYGLMFEVLAVALEVDFGDFFGVLRRALVAAVIEMSDLAMQAQLVLQQQLQSAQPLSPTSDQTGSSGA